MSLPSSPEPLFCPICGDSDHHNRLGGQSWCLNCNVRLVPKSKLPKHNRKERRQLAKQMRKKPKMRARGVHLMRR